MIWGVTTDSGIQRQQIANTNLNIKNTEESAPHHVSNNPDAIRNPRFKLPVQYEMDYFASSQCQIFIGDVWIDDINRIEWHAETPHIPIYGYASELFDTTTPGRTLITGAFAINFKEAGYLQIILDRYKNRAGNPYSLDNQKESQNIQKNIKKLKKGLKDPNPQWKDFASSELQQAIQTAQSLKVISPKAISDINPKEKTASVLKKGAQDTNQNTALSTLMGLIKNNDFQALADIYAQRIWGSTTGQDIPRADKMGHFDIFISYGDQNNPLADHTVRRIFGVKLVGASQVIEVGPGNVQEVYSFIGRDYR